MGTDYAGKERAFIAGLEAGTGRGLTSWLAAIAQTGLTDRNDIIDWLRQNRFTFDNASWIERIHHNGGRLVYAEDGERPAAGPPPLPSQRTAETAVEPLVVAARTAAPATPPVAPPAPPAASVSMALKADIAEALSAAKGLRPLAELVLRDIRAVFPVTALDVQGPLITLSAPRAYLALLPGPKALRLYGDFGLSDAGRTARAEAMMKIASKAPPPFASVIVLSDARLVDPTFRGLVQAAHTRAHD